MEGFLQSTLKWLMEALKEADVLLEGTILCVSTVREGKEFEKSSLDDRAFRTARALSRHVPIAVAGICVNSTNQEDRENVDALALSRLRELKKPWRISARVGQRAFKATLNIWNGQPANYKLAQDTFRCLLKNMEHQQEESDEKVRAKQAGPVPIDLGF